MFIFYFLLPSPENRHIFKQVLPLGTLYVFPSKRWDEATTSQELVKGLSGSLLDLRVAVTDAAAAAAVVVLAVCKGVNEM